MNTLKTHDQLQLFFEEWQRLPNFETTIINNPLPIPNQIILENFFNQFNQASEPIKLAKKQGLFTNVWEVAGLKRDEVRNSQVLKWFLDCNADHGLENQVLKIFLSSLISNRQFNTSTLQKYYSYAESYPINDGTNRVDIEIDADELLLFIEVKIDAAEGFEQLKRYQEIAEKKAKNKDWCIIYLTKNGMLPISYKPTQHLISLSWNSLAKAILEYIKRQNQQTHNIWLLKQFAKHIQTF
ncbi:PD-(D/E)XK nuclease family protein [Acinetobacter terrae]|jgi:hypothetical protein|uniref:PD-(D/E)XK nuclease family protein n=1 Tax=Acinetobacter terrae TaxID=2731247 RepID=UPI0007D7936B|nr:PD-(D/E)XK nuclease family protein [Acinetobacter terrae]OAL88382.1 hypothetical protein AY608_00905 [Acinetobacter terrae]